MLKSSLSLLASAALAVGASVATAQDFEWPDFFTVVTPNVGTANHSLGVAWTSEFSAQTGGRARVLPAPNGFARAQWLSTGEGDIVLMQASDYFDQMDAIDGYALANGGPEDTRVAMMNLVTPWSYMVRGDSDLQSLNDVKAGTRVSFTASSSFLKSGVDALLAYNGLTRDDVTLVEVGNYPANTKIVVEGRADVTFTSPLSGTSYEAEAGPNGVRWLALPEESADAEGFTRYRDIMTGYVPGTTVSGVDTAKGLRMDHAFQANHVRSDADEEFVYQLAKWLDEHHKDFKDDYVHAAMMSTVSMKSFLDAGHLQPLHEGTIRYLSELGIWTDAHQARQDALVGLAAERVALFQEAIAAAEAKGLDINPENAEWVDFWKAFKTERVGETTYGEMVMALPKG